MVASQPLLEVDLTADYPNKAGVLREVRFRLEQGEMLGLVGESGAGKSTIALALLGLLRWKGGRAKGHALFRGRDLLAASEKELRNIRGKDIALVPQSPLASLNSALRIGTQLREVWKAHSHGGRRVCDVRLEQALEQVGLPHDRAFLRRYPGQISVGQAQRVLIAMAVMHSPALLVADEPTSALDAMTQSEILNLLSQLNRECGMAVLYISHDLPSVVSLCSQVGILQDGSLVELGETGTVLRSPQHGYTKQLLYCAPWLEWWLQPSGGDRNLAIPENVTVPALQAPMTPVPPCTGLKSPYQVPMA